MRLLIGSKGGGPDDSRLFGILLFTKFSANIECLSPICPYCDAVKLTLRQTVLSDHLAGMHVTHVLGGLVPRELLSRLIVIHACWYGLRKRRSKIRDNVSILDARGRVGK